MQPIQSMYSTVGSRGHISGTKSIRKIQFGLGKKKISLMFLCGTSQWMCVCGDCVCVFLYVYWRAGVGQTV